MDVSVEPYGQYQGHNLYELTLTNDQGMVVKLLNYGATLEKVLLPEADGLHNMILSLPSRGRLLERAQLPWWHSGSNCWPYSWSCLAAWRCES